MTMIQNLLFLALLMSMTACSQFLTHRDYLSEMEQDDSKFYSPNRDFPVMAGDTGRTEESRSERRRRTPASAEQLQNERGTYSLNNELKQLENKLSESSFELYDQHKDKLVTTSEKIYFLKLPSRERKDYLISRGFLTEQKATNYREKMYANRQSSIILGMSKSDVMNNFGKPNRVEVAGNPSFENERWVYKVNGASKYIYFESGQVGGWE
jgi:hypothetical protein